MLCLITVMCSKIKKLKYSKCDQTMLTSESIFVDQLAKHARNGSQFPKTQHKQYVSIMLYQEREGPLDYTHDYTQQ